MNVLQKERTGGADKFLGISLETESEGIAAGALRFIPAPPSGRGLRQHDPSHHPMAGPRRLDPGTRALVGHSLPGPPATHPSNPAASTHAGVLEFIAEEGVVHLPHWMMQSLRLNEGDPIRVTGTELPKGKFVKLQPQSVHFLEISDPKAVYAALVPDHVLFKY